MSVKEAIASTNKQNHLNQTSSVQKKRIFSIAQIAKIALLAVIAFVLQLIDVKNIPLMPPWLALDFSDLPAMLAAFGMGPLAGAFVEVVKILLNVLLDGSNTAFVGEFANLIHGISLVIPAGLVYRKSHNRKGALLGLIAGGVTFCIAGVLLNIYVLLPMYAPFMGGMEQLLGLTSSINRHLDTVPKLVMFGMTPFNLIKSALLSVATMLLYKPLSPLLHRKW